MRTALLLACAALLIPACVRAAGIDCGGLVDARQFAQCMQDPENAAETHSMDEGLKRAKAAPETPAAQAARWRDQWQAKFEKYYELYDRAAPLMWGQAGSHPGWENPGTCERLTRPGEAMQSMRLQKFTPIVSELKAMDAFFQENERLTKEVVAERQASCRGVLADSMARPDNWKDPFCPWLKTMLCGDGKKSGGLASHWAHAERSLRKAGDCALGLRIGLDNSKYEEFSKVPVSARYDQAPPQTDCAD